MRNSRHSCVFFSSLRCSSWESVAQVWESLFSSFGYSLRSGIAGSCGRPVSLRCRQGLRNSRTGFHSVEVQGPPRPRPRQHVGSLWCWSRRPRRRAGVSLLSGSSRTWWPWGCLVWRMSECFAPFWLLCVCVLELQFFMCSGSRSLICKHSLPFRRLSFHFLDHVL